MPLHSDRRRTQQWANGPEGLPWEARRQVAPLTGYQPALRDAPSDELPKAITMHQLNLIGSSPEP